MNAAPKAPLHTARARPPRRREHPVTTEPIVGKDILELLSSGMYVDPRTLFRELIQNSADAIDAAFDANLFRDGELGRIDVVLDPETRSVRIRDNGVGLSAARAEAVLTAFGASAKRGTPARGSRGVGRFAAFGYAQSVVFKTKAAGERVSTEIRWDCRRLKVALADPLYDGDLRQLVRDVVTVAVEEESNRALHYFEVLLERVVRVKNDVLLNPDEVQPYLSQVAPAPFRDHFPYGEAVTQRVYQRVRPPRFRIFVNHAEDPIHRPHGASLPVSQTKTSSPTEIQFIELPDGDGGIRALIWLLHHSYLGALRTGSTVRGLRARVGDMQIGDGDVFAEAFSEPRFNSWAVGEVHIFDRRIIPNGRRDGFERNVAYTELVAQLVPVALDVVRRCRESSARRNRLRAFELRAADVRQLLEMLNQRGISRARRMKARQEIGMLMVETKRLISSAHLPEADQLRLKAEMSVLQSGFERLKAGVREPDPFAGIARSRRAAYEHAIDLIFECSPSKTVARALVDRIIGQLDVLAIPTSGNRRPSGSRRRRRSVQRRSPRR